MQANFDLLKVFDFANSSVLLWIYKKSSTAAKFKARHVPIDKNLEKNLTDFVSNIISRITEWSKYSYLSQPNENSCLSMEIKESDFLLLKNQVDQPEPENLVRGIQDLKGAEGYVVKFNMGADTIYAVKRSTSTWKTSYPKKFINMVFSNGEMSAAENNTFSIEKTFDFLCVNGTIFVINKRGFESALSHSAPYAKAFTNLQSAQAFLSLFTDVQPIVKHVGSNSIQLRRMAVIEQKGLYQSPNFVAKLTAVNAQRNWGINFCPTTGKIVPCHQTTTTIISILLDHRLVSEITDNTYDVPDAVQI